ncbi:Solute-binding protein [BD1-7 clade bacterium]|uniref:Solute-binding protein n=1 Tax=BD1-7 clade bacterium TaxID=2029982 RepID=A0A5S9PFL6_9GAMM|nr:Solute-binding protein [BD1-7 clade bacterium]CAA0102794.1 Solute-binding protein [BD1-7 clade bacterium]
MRKLFVGGIAAVLISLSSSTLATTFKIATLSPEGSYWMNSMREAGKEIAKRTEKRVRFRFYPGGVMGNDKAVLKKIRIGQLHGAAFSGGALAGLVPNTQVYNLPRTFKSYEEVDFVRQNMDQSVQKDFEDAGFVNFGLAEGGFAYLMSKKPITAATALKGEKVWVPADDPSSDVAVEAFNITPTPLQLGDVLASLQTDLINTVFASPIAAIALQWHTQVDYVTDYPLVYFYALLAIDQKAFNRLSAEDQATVRDVMHAAFKKIDKQNRKDNQEAFKALENQGIKVLQPTAEEAADWEAKSAATRDAFMKTGQVKPETYQQMLKLLEEFRAKQANNGG